MNNPAISKPVLGKLVMALGLLGFATLPAQAQDFRTADTNADGMVTMEEAKAAGLQWTDEQFASADADANGGLSEEEFKTAGTL